MKVVLDTSVLFAAFITRKGLCATVVEHALESDPVFLSQFILDELRRTLLSKSKLSEGVVNELIEMLMQDTTLVTPTDVDPQVCRDPNDAAILGTALAASADVLVSGDKDLLVLQRLGTIEIMTPREYHDRISKGS